MKRFLYFIDGISQKPSGEQLVDLAIADRFDGPCMFAPLMPGRGPDGRTGVIVAAGGDDPIGYYPERQVWCRVPGQPRLYLGHAADEPLPGPEDLARQRMLTGYAVRLGDGRDWVIPVARLLPTKLALSESGWDRRPDERYSALWDLSKRLLDAYWHPQIARAMWLQGHAADGKLATLTAEARAEGEALANAAEVAEAALDPNDLVTILAINYRIGSIEVSTLGLLEAIGNECVTAMEIINALVDGGRLLAASKKNESGSRSALR